ncbi:MAG TPA: hypothetical protein PLY93_12055, partial [Turneriella sp.]|nr:hypothetical protein [Turneriella sp.]
IPDALGKNFSERFSMSPAKPKATSRDLIVVGDTFGSAYFDWPQLKNLLLSVDSQKSAFCFSNAQGQVQALRPVGDKALQNQFLDKLHFFGGNTYNDALFDCAFKALNVSREEGREAQIVFFVSDYPRASNTQITLRSQMRRLVRNARILIAPASNATSAMLLFWQRIAREAGDKTQFIPLMQRVRIGLSSGQEWFLFRRGSRLYESRTEEKERFDDGIVIPDKYLSSLTNENLVATYQELSQNKVISQNAVESYINPVQKSLSRIFQSATKTPSAWRVLLEQNGQRYYLSLTPSLAQKLRLQEFARVYVELLPSTSSDVILNRPSPALLVDAVDSSPSDEIDVSDYIRYPQKYLRKAIGGRSFYILPGKVLQVLSPENDALESDF